MNTRLMTLLIVLPLIIKADNSVLKMRGVIEPGQENHLVLRGVTNIFAPSDVYTVRALTDKDTVLLRGEVTESLDPSSKAVLGAKNNPMMPIAWLHPYKVNGGTAGITFATTTGASVDLLNEDLRRLIVNATYHLTGLEVPALANVTPVDSYKPSFYGFFGKEHWEELKLKVEDFD